MTTYTGKTSVDIQIYLLSQSWAKFYASFNNDIKNYFHQFNNINIINARIFYIDNFLNLKIINQITRIYIEWLLRLW